MADRHEPSAMPVHCPDCDVPVIGTPHGYTLVGGDPSEGPPQRWTLLQCPGDHTILVLQEQFSGLYFDDDLPFPVYPPQDRRISELVPPELREAHEEARRCFGNKAYTGTVVMCGRTLEGTCEKQGIKEGNLQRYLDKMKAAGLIDGRLADWTDTLRDVRNRAAHFNDDQLTRQDAEDSLALNEAILDYPYVLSARFDAMKARRAP